VTQAPPLRKFAGFVRPEKNYFPMPNEWIDICAEIDNLAELKIIQYVLRHTWGFQEYGIPKTISVDEFMYGRKRTNGTRMDNGTGLKSDRSVKDGIKAAIEHGYLLYEIDTSDPARMKKSYTLKMIDTGVDTTPQVDTTPVLLSCTGVVSTHQRGSIYPPGGYNLPLDQVDTTPRSEKDTIERHYKKDTKERQEREVADATARSQSSQEISQDDEDTVKKEVVRGHHQRPIVDNHSPADSHQPQSSQPDPPRTDTNKVKQPPAPSKAHVNTSPFPVPKRARPQSNIMDEISLTPDEQVVFDAWCSLFKVDVPLIPANAKACKQLVKPLQVWTGILDKSTAEVLKLIMNWAYKNDKNGYYKRGFKLYDAAREFEGWQSAQERPQGDKEESNEHRVSSFGQPGYNFADEFYTSEAEKKAYYAAHPQGVKS